MFLGGKFSCNVFGVKHNVAAAVAAAACLETNDGSYAT
jgi:hypothetical protein